MSGINGLPGDGNDRWEQARRRARGLADYGLGQAVRTYYTIYFPVGLAALIVLGAVAAGLTFGDELGWPELIGFGFLLAGLGAMAGGLIYNSKRLSPAVEAGRVGVVLSLEDDEKKQIRRELLGKEPVLPEHLVVARGVAVQTRKVLALQLVTLPALPLAFIPQVFRADTFLWWLAALAIVFQTLAAVIAVRQFRQAGRFLAQTAGKANIR
ncbi:hypothetical protein ACFRAU_25040 [Arthrobacter sp. NPDC056691]|uniref:hypothetical protein n=1 Tax=Arthrobacter sp. NPDC056691 TaxID=3345913 RepID=UPI00366EB4E5